jgi:hypothetical protein
LARIPIGAPTRIEAKMRIEMPLPTPRFVMSSPIHMRSTVPAVRVTMIRTISPVPAVSAPWLRKRNAYPVACAAERTTVRYRVYCVILA